MNIDITKFNKFNVIDTCSIENILSSETLYNAVKSEGCKFCYTKFVEYEMLYKPRKAQTNEGKLSQEKLKKETENKIFECHSLSIEDLQEIEILEQRKKLGRGELSSIAFAKKINQSFMTDDRKARLLGIDVLGKDKVQTTPHLVGFLFYTRVLIDADISAIVQEHLNSGRQLGDVYKEAYHECLRIRCMADVNQV